MTAHAQHVRALERTTVWLSVARGTAGGRACREYVVYDDAGAPLLTARALPWEREIVVRTADEAAEPVVRLVRSLGFPLTGRVDVYDAAAARLGVVSRSGRYRAAGGGASGRFRDARTFGARTREGLIVGVLDALFGGDGTVAEGSRASGFVWHVGVQQIGTLVRAPLPFDRAPAQAAGSAGRFAAFKRRLRALAAPEAPRGWKLERLQETLPGDARLLLAAALFAIELSGW